MPRSRGDVCALFGGKRAGLGMQPGSGGISARTLVGVMALRLSNETFQSNPEGTRTDANETKAHQAD
jgi:hypothetical protein